MAVAVSLTPRAAADIASIRDFLLYRNPQAADRVRIALDATFALLERFPKAGRERPELDVRSIPVTSYPYTVYYRVLLDEVVVVHVRDDRRQPLAAVDL